MEQELKLLSEEEFEFKVEECRHHPDFKSYCDGIRYELGLESDQEGEPEWEWGEHEPYLDVLGLLVWAKAKKNMMDALGVQPPVAQPAKVEPKVEPPKPKVEPPKVETPALPPTPVETPPPGKVETPALPPETPPPRPMQPNVEPPKVETPPTPFEPS